LKEAQTFINEREDSDHIVVEVLPLSNYVKSISYLYLDLVDLNYKDQSLQKDMP
jgi:hypothetical protein